MNPEMISALSPVGALGSPLIPQQIVPAATEHGFGSMVSHGLDEVNKQLMSSQTDLQQLAVGDVQNLHQTMVRLEETRMSFQLMMQVRGRLLEAYQEVMKMQI